MSPPLSNVFRPFIPSEGICKAASGVSKLFQCRRLNLADSFSGDTKYIFPFCSKRMFCLFFGRRYERHGVGIANFMFLSVSHLLVDAHTSSSAVHTNKAML